MTTFETKRCHFVPRTYLEKFYQSDQNKRLLIAIKKSYGEIFHPKVSNICVRKYLYNLPGETEDERQTIEKFYSQNIENDYNSIYEILNKPQLIKISLAQRELIITTVITLLFRNPFLLDRLNEIWTETINRLYNLAERTPSRSFGIDDRTINIDRTSKKEFIEINNNENQQIFNISHIRLALRLIELRINDCISITEIEDNHEYITSDNPVTVTNTQTRLTGQFDPTNYLHLPINAKRCIVIYPISTKDFDSDKIYRRKVKGNSALLDTILENRLQHYYSDKFLIGSLQSLNGLDKQIKYSENELLGLANKVQNEMYSNFYEELRKKIK